jgi:hypothetical protein
MGGRLVSAADFLGSAQEQVIHNLLHSIPF